MNIQQFHEETKAKVAEMSEGEVRELLIGRTIVARVSNEIMQEMVEVSDKIIDDARVTIKRQRYTIYILSATIGALLVYIF